MKIYLVLCSVHGVVVARIIYQGCTRMIASVAVVRLAVAGGNVRVIALQRAIRLHGRGYAFACVGGASDVL